MHRDGERINISKPDDKSLIKMVFGEGYEAPEQITVEQAVAMRSVALLRGQQYYNRINCMRGNYDRYSIKEKLEVLNKSQAAYDFADRIEDCLFPDELPAEQAATEIKE